MVYKSNPEAYWFDDYTDLVDEGRVWGPVDDAPDMPASPGAGCTLG
jgi:hypothetical protein